MRLSKRRVIRSGPQTNSRWIAGSTYSVAWIRSSACLIVIGVSYGKTAIVVGPPWQQKLRAQFSWRVTAGSIGRLAEPRRGAWTHAPMQSVVSGRGTDEYPA